MKTTVPSVRLLSLGLCIAALVAVLPACEEDKQDDTVTPPSTKLSVQQIIVSPKAAAPGDTVTMTADIRSSSPNVGDIPVVKWTADDGSFVADNLMTVQWVAPNATGFFTITVKATNHAGTVTASETVFVGVLETRVAAEAGAVRMQQGGVDFYYLRSPDVVAGVEVFEYSGGASSDAVSPVRPTGFELVYAPNLAYEVHATTVTQPESLGIAVANPRSRQIYVGDFTLGTLQRISQDLSAFDSPRRNQYGFPDVSADAQLIAFQGVVTNSFSASLDSVDIFIYDRTGPTRVRATKNHANHRNYFPSFSPDQNWLTFISDRSGSNQWEMYGMRVTGTSVDIDPANVVRLTDTGGTMAPTRASGPGLPLRAWNPVSPVLATLSADNILYLMTTNGSGATLVDVSGLPVSVQELVWSRQGTRLGVVATGKDSEGTSFMQIYLVAGTSASLRYQAIPGDVVRDLAFSPDGDWLVFRLTRAGQAWLEIMDLGAGVTAQTVPLTRTFPAGDASTYRGVMSLSPAWGAGDILYMPVFTGAKTPAIMSLDVSGAVQ